MGLFGDRQELIERRLAALLDRAENGLEIGRAIVFLAGGEVGDDRDLDDELAAVNEALRDGRAELGMSTVRDVARGAMPLAYGRDSEGHLPTVSITAMDADGIEYDVLADNESEALAAALDQLILVLRSRR
jgi:hypothetical protein